MEHWFPLLAMGWCMAAMTSSGGEPERVRVACVGDSITFGDGLADPVRQSYPAVLQSLLGPRYEVRNFGVNGATALKSGSLPYWILPEFEAARRFLPHVVILMLGTNDANLKNRRERDRYEADLLALGRQLADLESRPAIVLGLPPPCYGMMHAYHEAVLRREIRPAIRRVAAQEKWSLADVRQALDDHSEWFPDGVHPDASGAAAIAQTVFSVVKSVSKERVSP